MKLIRVFFFVLCLIPSALMGATTASDATGNEFLAAAQLLAAAKNADIQQVQALINNGADVNYVDSTGLSLVCTALMNNDMRAAQILQMYGADASKCDQQIKAYKKKNTKEVTGGLFSGLSTAQGLALAAAGAAVVVGGVFLLTDWLDPGNENNGGGSSSGDRPGQGGDGGNSGNATAGITIPVGPAFVTTDGKVNYTTDAYNNNLAAWNPSGDNVLTWDFNYFRPTVQKDNNFLLDGLVSSMQNYLLMMHGYSSFANGYMGQNTFRDNANNPVKLLNESGGGKPVVVSLITANGINPTGSAARANGITYSDSAAANANTYTVDKYLNYASACVEGGTCGAEQAGFDLSGSGTAMNPFATPNENALAKIVAGWEAGGKGDNQARATGDLFGFVPNGQLAVYRTGGGKEWVSVKNPTEGSVLGTVTNSAEGGTDNVIDVGDTITLNGKTYTIKSALDPDFGVNNPTIEINGTKYKVPANSTMMVATCTSEEEDGCQDISDIAIYVGADGFYYINSTGGNGPDAVYVVSSNNIYAQKELKDADVKNFEAMSKSRGSSGVIANVSLNPKSKAADYLTMGGLQVSFNLNSGADKKQVFVSQIDKYYDNNDADSTSQGAYANGMYNSYGSKDAPIIVNPAGEFAFGQGEGKSLTVLEATFENYAPALYDNNLEHLFMTVVAVMHSKGTSSADTISGYGNGTGSSYGPLYLATWSDNKGTPEEDDDIIYQSRKCGIAGLGINGIDPWCFSAAGATSEMATAAAAGAVAALKGAFSYMSSKEIFTLLALTADGYLLGTNTDGTAFTTDTLAAYLKAMYSLPPEYNATTLTSAEYLKAFAEVYGYGLINLERAMTPGKSIYYFDGTNIVSSAGNAYWRSASNTIFRASSAFSPSTATISAPFFDILESIDGEISMPRIWKNEFALGVQDKRGLYMGDVLGDLKTRDVAPVKYGFGNMTMSMAMSERPYVDNLSGLDVLRFDYSDDAWNFTAQYQHYLTETGSRFNGFSNPVLAMSSDIISTDAAYKLGNWSFGAKAFSGAITDEELLETDPTISSQYMPARLGLMQGAESNIAWQNDKFSFISSFGMAHETDTILGAQTGGLLDLGQGNTSYIDSEFRYSASQRLTLKMRSTFARTVSDASGEFILGMSDIYSDAFAFGLDFDNFSFSVSRPLGISRGSLNYAYADYDVVETESGKYDLVVKDTHVERLDLSPENRELRFMGTIRHNFGPWTDGALGFIYRVNPNNTKEFGNESIFMMKLSHRLGI